jgi:cytochrome b involved in lipid metabolism
VEGESDMDHTLTTLFHSLADQEKPPVLELLDINNKPVGALYLDKIRYKNFIVSETNNSEKYYLYIDGVGIYFSFYQKINT